MSTTPTARRALVYARASQDREGAGLAVDRQEADCRQLAATLGWEVVAVHVDNDLSAYNGKARPGYQALLDDLRGGRADAVLCWHGDRLHRRPLELEEYIAICESRQVPTMTVRAGPVDLSTPSGRAVARTVGAWARFEVEHMIERQQAARLQAVGDGRWTGGRRPYGYADDGVTVVVEEAVELQRVAEDVLAGASLTGLARDLNVRGRLTSTGKPWKATELKRVLMRPRNAGLIQYRGEVAGKANWKPILEEDTWRAVTSILTAPGRRSNTSVAGRWLLSGIAVCGVCGAPVRSSSAGSSRGRPTSPTYTCRTGKHVVRDAAACDRYVAAVVVARLERPDVALGELLDAGRSRADRAALHVKADALRGRLTGLATAYADGSIDARQLRDGSDRVRSLLGEVEGQLAQAARGTVLDGLTGTNAAEVWGRLPLARQRAVVRLLVDVTILPARKGRRPGWQAGEPYFDPASVRVTPKAGE